MAGLGFNWQVSQPALVTALTSNAGNAGLYTQSQLQALGTGALLKVTGGTAKLTIGVEKSTNLSTFVPLPMTQPQTLINAQGKLEFTFPVPDNAAFYRLVPLP